MEIKYIDIHSHLNLSPLLENQKEIIERIKEKGIATITVGTGLETSREAVRLAEENDFLYATVGIHPNSSLEEFVPSDSEGQNNKWQEFSSLAENKKVVAIGETGLDYFRLGNSEEGIVNREETKNKQKEIFIKHIELAKKLGKPLMIHARPSKGTMDAYEDVLNILSSYKLETENYKLSANFHFFVGNIDIAKRALEAGHTMSFDGPITFSGDYDEVIKFLPLTSIMAETDAPYAAPTPYRGKTCEPWMVEEVYKAIARIKGIDEEEVRMALIENAKRFFKLDF